MNQRGFINNIILVIAVVALISVGAYFAFVKRFQPATQTLPLASQKPSANQPTPIPQSETANWKTYRNEKYGIAFKYPDSLKVLEHHTIHTGDQIVIVPINQQIKNDVYIMPVPTISISNTCLIPKSTSEKSWESWEEWENNFQQPLVFGPFYNIISGGFLKTFNIGARSLFVFAQGCYECYDGASGPDPNTEYNGFTAYSCEAGLNKNGNKAANCLAIITERQKIGSPELEKLKKFFLDDFIPTLEFQQSLMIQDCEGLGESVG